MRNKISLLLFLIPGVLFALIYVLQDPLDPPRYTTAATIQEIELPQEYRRVECSPGSFGEWLRKVALKSSNIVHYYDGRRKGNQSVQFAVLDVDVGNQDLQQCADAAMRLRAEYLFAVGRKDDIHFRFTNGTEAKFRDWMKGLRPVVKGNSVQWVKKAKPDSSYKALRDYLIPVFRFCGTASLERELASVELNDIQPGDVILQGGFPGHAIMVVDMGQNPNTGAKCMLLAQSYMPAQDIHILRNPNSRALSPWYRIQNTESLITPEWEFRNFPTRIKRFR